MRESPLLGKLRRELRSSEVRKFRGACAQGRLPAFRPRPLTPDEITQLEREGNRCHDWSEVQVAPGFRPGRILNCYFSGQVILGEFFGTVRTPEGISAATGLYHCNIHQSVIDNAHCNSVGTISHMVILNGALIRNTGSLAASGRTAFGIGRQLTIGMEVGGRTLIGYPEIDLETAEAILFQKQDAELQHQFQVTVQEFREEIEGEYGYVGPEAIIVNTKSVRNSWIGAAARIDGATKVSDSCLLSSAEQPTLVRDGAIVEHSLLQWGSRVESHGWVSDALLLEASSVSRNARVRHSLIAPNSHPQVGEVTSSLIGPFAGFRHQAQIVSALWPAGMGTVSAGCNIGADSSGRPPNQEGLLGCGQFFGLGVTVKYPVNLSEAPWSFFAADTTMEPQRLRFPFSLVRPATAPHLAREGLNELRPGWALEHNALALSRSIHKFGERDRTRNHGPSLGFLNAETAALVLVAMEKLLRVGEIRDCYYGSEIPGLGANYLMESHRQRGLRAYATYLERFALHQAIVTLEEQPELLRSGKPLAKILFGKELVREICRHVTLPVQLPLILRHYRTAEKGWRDSILRCIEEDRKLGSAIFDDWQATQSPKEGIWDFVQQDYEAANRRVRNILTLLRG